MFLENSFKARLFVFSSCITESEVSNEQSDEPGEDNGKNFSHKTYHNIGNLTELWLT